MAYFLRILSKKNTMANFISFTNLHNLSNPVTTNFLKGNIGDIIEVKIELDFLGSFKSCDFYFGLQPNTYQIYNRTNFIINQNAFRNLQTNAIQKLSIPDINAITQVVNVGANKSFDTTQNFEVSIGTGVYIFTHRFRLPYYLNEGIASPFQNPFWSNSGQSLLYFFKIDTFDINGSLVDTTDNVDLSSLFIKGDVGAFNERFSGSLPYYLLDSADAITGFTGNTPVTKQVKIKSQKTSFDKDTKITAYLVTLPSTYNPNLTLNGNQDFDTVQVLADQIPVSSAKLTNVSAEVLASDLIEVTYTLAPGIYENLNGVWFAVSNANQFPLGATQEHNNITPVIFEKENENVTDIVLDFSNFRFLPWWDTNTENAKTCYNGFQADDGAFLVSVTNSNEVTGAIQSIEVGIKEESTGNVAESYLFTSFANIVTRGNTRAIGDVHNQVSVIENQNTFDISYGFNISNLLLNSPYVGYVKVGYLNNGTVFFTERQSPSFGTAPYDALQNAPADPQMELLSIEFFQVDGSNNPTGSPLSAPVFGVKNLVRATWHEVRIGDMQRDQSALKGYLAVVAQNQEAIKEEFRYIFSDKDNETFSPWIEVNGATANRANVIKQSATVAYVEAILDWNAYTEFFGTEDPCIIARLDATCDEVISPPEDGNKVLNLFHFREVIMDVGGDPPPPPPPVDDVTGPNVGWENRIVGPGITPPIHTFEEWEVPNNNYVGFYIQNSGAPVWVFLEQIFLPNAAAGTGIKVASTGRTASGNYTIPDPTVWDNSTAINGGGYMNGTSYPNAIPDRLTEYITDTSASTYLMPANAGNQILWYKNTTGTTVRLALRCIASNGFMQQTNTLLVRRIS